MAIQILTVTGSLLDANQLAALGGRTLKPEDLGPMKPGDKLGRTCGKSFASEPFSGRFTGKVMVNNVEFDVQLEMERQGDRVIGKYSIGLGVGRFRGEIRDDQLQFQWQASANRGQGVLRLERNGYAGTWGVDGSSTNGGTWRMKPD